MRQLLLDGTALAECECGGQMVVRTARNEHQFLGCSNYPECQETMPIPAECLLAVELKLYRVGAEDETIHIVMVEEETRAKFRLKLTRRGAKGLVSQIVEEL